MRQILRSGTILPGRRARMRDESCGAEERRDGPEDEERRLAVDGDDRGSEPGERGRNECWHKPGSAPGSKESERRGKAYLVHRPDERRLCQRYYTADSQESSAAPGADQRMCIIQRCTRCGERIDQGRGGSLKY